MKKALIAMLCLALLVSAAFALEETITGNIVKLPLLKNLVAKNNAAPAEQPPSEDEMELREGTFSANIKRTERYYGKQAFVVSDKDWHNVLSLVPVSLWYEGGELKKYPVLIYHEEDNGFDADSAITFLRQYNSKKVVLVGDTPEELDNILIADGYTYLLEADVEPVAPEFAPLTGRPIANIPPPRRDELISPVRGIDLTPDWLTRISPDDYTRYWSRYNTVVVCEDNYQLGLLASVYASYLNAPLFFEGRVPSDVSLARKRIVTVGRTSYTGAESYNLAQIEQKLARDYPTDKIILVNYNDLAIRETRPLYMPYTTMLNRAEIEELYSKTSLSAPFLAAGKNEFIITTDNTDKNGVKVIMEWKIARYGLDPKYLTIMASPPAIQMDENVGAREDYTEVDNHIYGDMNVMGVVDGLQDLAVGRIFSLTPSDVSSYVARDLFIEYFGRDRAFASLWPAAMIPKKADGKATDKAFRNAGFRQESVYTDEGTTGIEAERDMNHKSYIAYLAHGTVLGWGGGIQTDTLRSYNIHMDPAIVFSVACDTCAYSLANAYASGLFCANILKHGAIAHIGAVDGESVELKSSSIIANELLNGKDIGQAMLRYKQIFEAYGHLKKETQKIAYPSGREELPYEPVYVLLGDPTIRLTESPYETDEVAITEEDATFTDKIIRIRIEQADDNFMITCDRDGGAECSRGEFTFYENPVSKAYVDGIRKVEDELDPEFVPVFGDMIYLETDGFTEIASLKLKITYADGRSESHSLTRHGDLFYKCSSTCLSSTEDLIAQVYDLKTGGNRHRIFLNFNKRGIGADKIIPGYSYELELKTETATGTRRFD
ncbi:MAG TPA: hypothetical protein HA362_02160 [Nanoarchaeota archaeon]|nr:hypothetical protein [Nanoarchaeota archaeon]